MSYTCVVCGGEFTPTRRTDKACSLDCSIAHRRELNREKAAKHYKPRPPRPDVACESCGTLVKAPKCGPMPRWCPQCRANRASQRASGRYVAENRRCHKCGEHVPEAIGKPGLTVCDACRADRRDPDKVRIKERRRTLRKYGITDVNFDAMLSSQGGKCRGCGTRDPGGKGWNIDHCHTTGAVRAILCHRCNTAIGLANEDPRILRALADLVTEYKAEQIKI